LSVLAVFSASDKLGDREKEVAAEMRIKSYRYGKEQVPFSEEDLAQLKFQTEKGIQILSFIPQRSIPRHHYMGSVDWSVESVINQLHSESASCGLV
jgi:hypothetical protein